MDGLFTIENLFTLGMLVMLQAVLGFDNLLYISIESQRVEASRQRYVRHMGIGLAILFRLVFLVLVVGVIERFSAPLFGFDIGGVKASFTLRSIRTAPRRSHRPRRCRPGDVPRDVNG